MVHSPTWWRRVADAYGWRDMRAYGRTAWVVTGGTALLGIGRGIVAPFLVLYLVDRQGIDPAVIGLGITMEFMVRALVGPVAGAASDRFGRKPLMLAGLVGTAFLIPAYLLVESAGAYLVLSVVNGALAAHSLYGPAANALIADTVPPQRRGAVYGLIHASRNLGWTFGIAAGALLLAAGYVPVFVAGGLLPFLYLFVVWLLVPEPPVDHEVRRASPFRAWGALLRTRAFVLYLVLTLVFYASWGHVTNVLPLFVTRGLGLPEQVLALIGLNTLLIFFLQVPFGRLADRTSRSQLLAWSALACAATFALYVWTPLLAPGVPAVATLAAALVVFTLAEMLFSPILSAFAADIAPKGTTGSAMGVLSFAAAVGHGAPLLLADAVVPGIGWGGYWALLAALCVPSALGLLRLGRTLAPGVDRPTG